jgi:ABC-type sugar transport system ATPase subunit
MGGAAADRPADAAALGLRFVHQELNIVPSPAWPRTSFCRAARRAASASRWTGRDARPRGGGAGPVRGDHIDPGARAGSLSTGDRMLTVLAGLLASDDTAALGFRDG